MRRRRVSACGYAYLFFDVPRPSRVRKFSQFASTGVEICVGVAWTFVLSLLRERASFVSPIHEANDAID